MTDLKKDLGPQSPAEKATADPARRAALRRLGRFAAVTPPVVTLLMSATTKSAKAVISPAPSSSRQFKEPVSVSKLQAQSDDTAVDENRRATLRRLGRFATITPPAVTLLLAAKVRPAVAASGVSSRQLKEPVSVAQLADQARVDESRRATLRRLGRFAAVTPPAIALILAAGTRPSKALPISEVPSSRQFKEPVSIAQLQ